MEQNVGGAAFGLAIVVIIAQLAALALGAGALRLSLRPDAPIHPAAAVFATVWALSVAGAWLQVTLAAALGGTLGWGRSTAQSVAGGAARATLRLGTLAVGALFAVCNRSSVEN